MSQPDTADTTTFAVNLRMRGDARALIDCAAKARGKSRTEFMIDAALRSAEEAFLDQTLVRVDAETLHSMNGTTLNQEGLPVDRR
jgi:uncharacterized protein (DUF1778 family)